MFKLSRSGELPLHRKSPPQASNKFVFSQHNAIMRQQNEFTLYLY